jgi:hypothetical protein
LRPLAAVEDHAPSSGGIVAAWGTHATGNQHCWKWSWPLVPGPRQSPFCRAFQCILPLARSSFVIRELLAYLLEPPCTDPYARWCGRGRQATAAPMPISRQTAPYSAELKPYIVLTEPQPRHRTPPAWMRFRTPFGDRRGGSMAFAIRGAWN